MRRAAMFLISVVSTITLVLGAPAAAGAPPAVQPTFSRLQGCEMIDVTYATWRRGFDATAMVRNVTGSKTTSYTVTFTVTFSTGATIVRTNPVVGTSFASARLYIPVEPWWVFIPTNATWISVTAALNRTTVKTGATAVIDRIASGPQALYTIDQMNGTRLGCPLFTISR